VLYVCCRFVIKYVLVKYVAGLFSSQCFCKHCISIMYNIVGLFSLVHTALWTDCQHYYIVKRDLLQCQKRPITYCSLDRLSALEGEAARVAS